MKFQHWLSLTMIKYAVVQDVFIRPINRRQFRPILTILTSYTGPEFKLLPPPDETKYVDKQHCKQKRHLHIF